MTSGLLQSNRFSGIDFLDPVLIQNPYDLYSEIRESSPVFWNNKLQALVLLSYDLVASAYRDPLVGGMPRFPHPALEPLNQVISHWLLDRTGEDHQIARKKISPHFSKETFSTQTETFRTFALDILNQCKKKKSFDFIKDFATKFPNYVLTYLLGIPLEDHEKLAQWSVALYYVIGATKYNHNFRYLLHAKENAIEGTDYFLSRIKEKRKEPGEDIISRMIRDRNESEDFALASELLLMVTAGFITSRDQFGTMVKTLLEHEDQWDRIKNDHSLIPGAVEECLRFESALQAPGHLVVRDTEFHGIPIKKGSAIITVIGSANRDPSIFDRPGTFDIHRETNPHIAFGLGPHTCLGSHLFRLEASIVLESILEVIPEVSLSQDSRNDFIEYSFLIRGLSSLQLSS